MEVEVEGGGAARRRIRVSNEEPWNLRDWERIGVIGRYWLELDASVGHQLGKSSLFIIGIRIASESAGTGTGS